MAAPRWFRRELEIGVEGPDVTWVRKFLIMANSTGPVDYPFQAYVRAFQFTHHLPTTGVVDEGTAVALGEPAYIPRPSWWAGPKSHNDSNYGDYLDNLGLDDVFAVRRLRNSLGLSTGDSVDDLLMDALSLWQRV